MRKLGTFLLAAAALTLETALTRVFALAHGHHFAFLTISVALMGLGAGGTAVTLWTRAGHTAVLRGRGLLDRVLVGACLAFAVATLGSYVLLNVFPFDIYQIAWDPRQVLYLLLNYLALTLPFFCSGLAVALLLEVGPAGNVTYAANLLGSASGCLITLVMLPHIGGSGSIDFAPFLSRLKAGEEWRFLPS